MQPTGYKSFKPQKLPPKPEIIYDSEMMRLLSEADRKLGRLDGVTQILPNPDLFVVMYVKKEAVLSSQIEGTQASLSDLLEIGEYSDKNADIVEIVNYISALKYGLERIMEFPLSLRLLREIHEKLLSSGRGSERNPGDFRNSQNWIGPKGCTLQNATFVPPSVQDTHLFEYLFEEPYINKNKVKEYLDVSYPTAGKIVDEFCELGILRDYTPHQQRNKAYYFAEYLKILNRGTEL